MTPEEQRRREYQSPEHIEGRARALRTASPMDQCPRCRLPLGPDVYRNPRALHYDHRDDRDGYLGLSHDRCNREAGARKGAAVTNAMRHGRAYRPVVDW